MCGRGPPGLRGSVGARGRKRRDAVEQEGVNPSEVRLFTKLLSVHLPPAQWRARGRHGAGPHGVYKGDRRQTNQTFPRT